MKKHNYKNNCPTRQPLEKDLTSDFKEVDFYTNN